MTARTLPEALADWVARGLITDEQAEEIAAAEGITDPTLTPRRLPFVAEGLGYVGAVVALMGGIAVTAKFWGDLEKLAQVAVLGLVSALLVLAGVGLRPERGAAARRLGSLFWLLSVIAFGVTLFLAFSEFTDLDGDSTGPFWGFVGIAAFAGVLWWRRPSEPQQLALFVSLQLTLQFAFQTMDHPPTGEWRALASWGLAVMWVVLGAGGLIRPERFALGLGSLGVAVAMFAGGFMANWPLVLGFFCVVGMLVAGVVMRRAVLVAMGGLGTALLVPVGIGRWVGGSPGALVALTLVGLAIAGAGALVARGRTLERVEKPA